MCVHVSIVCVHARHVRARVDRGVGAPRIALSKARCSRGCRSRPGESGTQARAPRAVRACGRASRRRSAIRAWRRTAPRRARAVAIMASGRRPNAERQAALCQVRQTRERVTLLRQTLCKVQNVACTLMKCSTVDSSITRSFAAQLGRSGRGCCHLAQQIRHERLLRN
eukprot:5372096-Pleurochrysis_carterae.AAC.1